MARGGSSNRNGLMFGEVSLSGPVRMSQLLKSTEGELRQKRKVDRRATERREAFGLGEARLVKRAGQVVASINSTGRMENGGANIRPHETWRFFP